MTSWSQASVRLVAVSFRQQVGPSASASQLRRLQALLDDVGYADFRSARGPFGLTQRQGLGKFTAAEAEDLIERLEQDVEDDLDLEPVPASAVPPRPLEDTPTGLLVAELEARGWSCSPG